MRKRRKEEEEEKKVIQTKIQRHRVKEEITNIFKKGQKLFTKTLSI